MSLVSRGKHTRSLQGASGREIKLKRTYGTCSNCGTSLFSLDEKLEPQPGSLTPLQLSYLIHFATLVSFEQAAKFLMQHHGVYVSASTSRRQTEAIGVSAEIVQNEQEKSVLQQDSSLLEKDILSDKSVKQVMISDGAYISLRGKYMWKWKQKL